MVNTPAPKKKKSKGKADGNDDMNSADLSTTSPPYLIFCFEKRKEIKIMYPQSTIPEQSHLLEQMWSSLDFANKQVRTNSYIIFPTPHFPTPLFF